MLYQQGDVLLISVDEIPEKAKKVAKQKGRYILAEGEATGHAHAVIDKIGLFNVEDNLFLNATKEFTVTHEEHKNITVPPGKYKIHIVKEYDHFEEEARKVRD